MILEERFVCPRGNTRAPWSSFPLRSRNARDVENLKIAGPANRGGIELGMRFARLQRSHGLPATFFSRSPMTEAANICGLEQFCRWIIKAPELCRRLLDMTLDHISNVLQYWVDTFRAENVFIYMSSPERIQPGHLAQSISKRSLSLTI